MKIKNEKAERQSLFGKLMRKINLWFYGISCKISARFSKNKKIRTKTAARRSLRIFYASLVILPVIQFCIFYIGVNFNSFFLAFKTYSPIDGFSWCGFDNFKLVFDNLRLKNSALQNALINSLIVYGIGLLTTPFGILFAYYVYKKLPAAGLFKILLFLPSILSTMVMALLYQYVVDQVLVDVMHKWFGKTIHALLFDSSTRFWATWFFCFWFGFGSSVLMYTGAMSRIPVSVVEYAKLDGVGLFREFWQITFPLVFPTFSTFFILGFVGIFTNQMNLYTFFGTSSLTVQTVGYYAYRTVLASAGYADYPFASALGLTFTIIIAPLTFIVRKIVNKLDPAVDY